MRREPGRVRRALLLAACLCLTAMGASAAVDRNDPLLKTDHLAASVAPLPADGVLVLLFSLPDCHWCHQVRQAYLLPLTRDRSASAGLAIAELGLTDEPVRDLDGQLVAIEALTARWSVKAAPTVLFLDRCGVPLSEALVGGDVAGFYSAYFDRALAEARRAATAHPRGC